MKMASVFGVGVRGITVGMQAHHLDVVQLGSTSRQSVDERLRVGVRAVNEHAIAGPYNADCSLDRRLLRCNHCLTFLSVSFLQSSRRWIAGHMAPGHSSPSAITFGCPPAV